MRYSIQTDRNIGKPPARLVQNRYTPLSLGRRVGPDAWAYGNRVPYAVIHQRDARPVERSPVQCDFRFAAAHAAGVVHDDDVVGPPVSILDRELGPRGGRARLDEERIPTLCEAQDGFHADAVHP